MPNYNRDFLIPYLKDVSALHCALFKLEKRLAVLEQQKCSAEENFHFQEYPRSPYYEAANGVFVLGVGFFIYFLATMAFMSGFWQVGLLGILFGSMAVIVGVLRYFRVTLENNKKEARYNEKMAAYREHQIKNATEKKALNATVNEILQCQDDIKKVKTALERTYRTNIFPEQYRTAHAAVFLYNWFSTGRSEDLDMAFKLLRFDDIVQKLDRIIANETDAILEQYFRLAEQRQEPMVQQAYIILMKSKLDELEVSGEERSAYLAMLDGNTATMSCFSKIEYIKTL